ncbi:NADH:ubiquinone reductase (non-electrogenic) [Bertholletia excelsa]
MANITFSASAALSTFNREHLQLGISVRAKRWGNLFFPVSGTKSSISRAASRSGLPIVGALSADTNRGTVEVPQDERVLRTYVWLDKQQPRVCIIGGGFGGLYTALRIESLVWPDDKKPQVLLVDQSDRFVFKPMLYELLSGEVDVWEIAPRFSDLLANTGVQFLQDRVKRLQPLDNEGTNAYTGSSCGGTVLLESGLLVEYDWLVLALGAETKVDTIPGAAEFAFPFSTLDDACKVDGNLRMLERKYFGKDIPIRVAIVGCGYSGVELAATLSERLKDKGLVQAINVDTTILPNASPGNREAALKVR